MPARLVGINHVAIEVGDIDEALAWYGRFFTFELRGRIGNAMAFVDMGDQFLALAHRGLAHPRGRLRLAEYAGLPRLSALGLTPSSTHRPAMHPGRSHRRLYSQDMPGRGHGQSQMEGGDARCDSNSFLSPSW
jgi:catechol 2,3-dioxygenase-like lactoylglutathione lyase family enzyme